MTESLSLSLSVEASAPVVYVLNLILRNSFSEKCPVLYIYII